MSWEYFDNLVLAAGLNAKYWKPMKHERYLNYLRRTIAELVQIGEIDLPSFMADLEGTNWDEWQQEVEQAKKSLGGRLVPCQHCSHNMLRTSRTTFAEHEINICASCQQKYDDNYQHDMNTPRQCTVCNGSHTPLELVETSIPGGLTHIKMKICPTNPELALDPYMVVCIACDRKYLPFRSKSLCDTCWEGSIHLEWKRVNTHNSRARTQGQAATLTLKQWLRTLDHFHQKCAYCQKRDYSDLEHYNPLPKGGTTADNCLPSCGRCNRRKKDRSPDDLVALFPVENLERITSYFESVKVS